MKQIEKDKPIRVINEKALILVVDDNPTNLQVLGALLRREKVVIAVARNGEKALSIAKSRIPDLILLDIMMPGMDGYKVCELLKEDERTAEVPIIFLTARVSEEDIVRGFKIGAVDYVTKPFNHSELISRVNTHLRLKKFKDELTRKNKTLERLLNDRNEFLGIAAHDLKNPIFSISMLAKTLRDDETLTKEEIGEFAGDIVTTSDRMVQLISNLLDINKIEDGRIKINIENADLSELLQSILHNYREPAKAKNISIETNIAEFAEAFVDRNATLQIFDNLISNAIKYSPLDKKVWVSLADDVEGVRFEVRDEGPGLTEDDKNSLFKKFARLSAQPTGNEHSTGLGLSIVKKYVEMISADIKCESEPGEGAAFIVNFKKEQAES